MALTFARARRKKSGIANNFNIFKYTHRITDMKKTTTSECELVKLKERNYIRLGFISFRMKKVRTETS